MASGELRYGSLLPEGYCPRIVDEQVERYLSMFGAVEIAGTKWCGKTWTACAHGNSIAYLDEGNNLQLAKADPLLVLEGDQPHIVDEWQKSPSRLECSAPRNRSPPQGARRVDTDRLLHAL